MEYLELLLWTIRERFWKIKYQLSFIRCLLATGKALINHNLAPTCVYHAGSKGSQQFVERCVAYVGENALEVMHTSGFLALTRDAMTTVISSDNVMEGVLEGEEGDGAAVWL